MVIGRFLRRFKKSQSNTFEPNAYIGESPTVKHGEQQHRHEHHRQEGRRQEPQHTQVHGTLENQSDLHGRIRLARRQHRFLHEQASSYRDRRVIPMWDEVDWNEKATPKPDAWQDDVEWETIDE